MKKLAFIFLFLLSACSSNSSSIDQNTVVTASYASIYAGVLKPGCTGCHGSSGGYNFESYAGTVQAVVSGSASTSPLYTSISSGRMPKSGTVPSAAQLAAIASWINAGAPNN